jgi:sialate O-acetylesterase
MKLTTLTTLLAALAFTARAELKLPAIIGDNMVLQQKQTNPLWGWDTPGTEVTVKFAGQTKSAKADADGKWTVKLDPVPANAKPATISIKGSSAKELQNVLVGEVWICSGQSNMQMSVNSSWDADLETAAAKYPNIRLITVPNVGTQEPQSDFKGAWAECSPQNVGGFSAVGFFFGRVLHKMLDVPVGLINNAWGGSAAEAWVRRDLLEKDPRFKLLMANTKKNEAFLTSDAAKKQYETNLAELEESRPTKPRQPANLSLHALLEHPMAGCVATPAPATSTTALCCPPSATASKAPSGIRAKATPAAPMNTPASSRFMIQDWRTEWKQGDFSFYWVQLADFMAEKADLSRPPPAPGPNCARARRKRRTPSRTAARPSSSTSAKPTTSIRRTSATWPNASPAGRWPRTTA